MCGHVWRRGVVYGHAGVSGEVRADLRRPPLIMYALIARVLFRRAAGDALLLRKMLRGA
jgi:hypothetical protein